MTADKYDGKLNFGIQQGLLKFQSTSSRQSDVQHDTAWRIGKLLLQEFPARRERLHLQTDRAKEVLHRFANGDIVVDHDHDSLVLVHELKPTVIYYPSHRGSKVPLDAGPAAAVQRGLISPTICLRDNITFWSQVLPLIFRQGELKDRPAGLVFVCP